MTMLDVLIHPAVLGGSVWVRPVAWRGGGCALATVAASGDLTRLVIVPSGRGGDQWHPYVEDLIGEWEPVSPGDVLDEGGGAR